MHTPPTRRPLLTCLVLLLTLGSCSRPSHADCIASSQIITFPDPLLIPYDAKPGYLIAEVTMQTKVQCNAQKANKKLSWAVYQASSNTDHGKAPGDNVRHSGTQGIGIRWLNRNDHSHKSQTFSATALNNDSTNLRGIKLSGQITITDTIQLIKTGDITSNVLLAQRYLMRYKNDKRNPTIDAELFSYTFNQPAIRVIGCSFRNASQTVRLPDVSTSDFVGTGRAGDKQFNIDLDCAPGTSISAKLSDANARGNTGTLLSIAGGRNNAQGIGLELQRQGETGAYVLGTEFTSLAARQQHALPMVVRYAVNGAPIQPGEVNAAATVELSFD
ncbi:hypothetical protein B0T40_22120 [Chromobacterium haemolyticum]|uniref:fimbrial protein n=1 Tax=Chromobacterium haemolyticum TaxID=394935 RepID=UPI0009D94CCD|nr:fimbrial protein [Chromobacterium haemolyticum]OQS31506.1 hypothetical protein B0T40_22120 [Chromobacterium haemolyticum]